MQNSLEYNEIITELQSKKLVSTATPFNFENKLYSMYLIANMFIVITIKPSTDSACEYSLRPTHANGRSKHMLSTLHFAAQPKFPKRPNQIRNLISTNFSSRRCHIEALHYVRVSSECGNLRSVPKGENGFSSSEFQVDTTFGWMGNLKCSSCSNENIDRRILRSLKRTWMCDSILTNCILWLWKNEAPLISVYI